MNPLLQVAEEYLRTEVMANANEMDRSTEALRHGLEGLCDRKLMALRRPAEWGGPELADSDFRAFQEAVARASGALAFLQTQHQSAVSMIAKGDNEDLKNRCLPEMDDGTLLMGIGFSQLRRAGPPLLEAQQTTDGVRLTGQAPWVTGLGFFHKFLVGASLPDGRAVFGVVPFAEDPGLSLGPVMRLAAMESPQTVAVDFADYPVPNSNISFIKPPNWIHDNDLINITVQGFFAIGCALAGLDCVQRANRKKNSLIVSHAAELLASEVDSCRSAMKAAQEASTENVTTAEKLRVRALAIDLAVRCAQAGVAATGGAANSIDNDAQRVYREALVYTVSAQTAPIMEATLQRLSQPR